MKKLLNFINNHIDKVLHICISYILMTYFGAALPIWMAALFTIIIGIVKELYDQKDYGGFSWKDLIADVVGIVLGIIQLII